MIPGSPSRRVGDCETGKGKAAMQGVNNRVTLWAPGAQSCPGLGGSVFSQSHTCPSPTEAEELGIYPQLPVVICEG